MHVAPVAPRAFQRCRSPLRSDNQIRITHMCDPPLEATARFRLLADPPGAARRTYGTYTVITDGSAAVPAGAITRSWSVATKSYSSRLARPAGVRAGSR